MKRGWTSMPQKVHMGRKIRCGTLPNLFVHVVTRHSYFDSQHFMLFCYHLSIGSEMWISGKQESNGEMRFRRKITKTSWASRNNERISRSEWKKVDSPNRKFWKLFRWLIRLCAFLNVIFEGSEISGRNTRWRPRAPSHRNVVSHVSCANYQTLEEAAKDLGAHLALTAMSRRALWRTDKIGFYDRESGKKKTVEWTEWTEFGSGVRGPGFKWRMRHTDNDDD